MRGQTIIEVLVALTTAVVIIAAITIAVLTALRNAQYSNAQNTATRYAQEGMEFVRFLRDSNYPEFAKLESVPTQYCLGKGSTTLQKDDGTNQSKPCTTIGVVLDNGFSRIVTFESNDAYCDPLQPPTPAPTIANTSKKVTVTVAWTDAKCPNSTNCHEAKLISCFSDYTLVPTIGEIPTPTPQL